MMRVEEGLTKKFMGHFEIYLGFHLINFFNFLNLIHKIKSNPLLIFAKSTLFVQTP